MAEFHSVGPAEVEDGEADAFEVDGRKVAVANIDGSLYAFDDTCTHMGCSSRRGSSTAPRSSARATGAAST